MRVKAAVFATVILLLCEKTTAKYSKGHVVTKKNWVFLDRFCFLSEKGTLRYRFRYPVSYEVQNLYLYYDSANQWPAVYKTGKTCLQKEAVLRRENYQIINMSSAAVDDWSPSPGCQIIQKNGQNWYECDSFRQFKSYRERWWYLALGNCNSSKGLFLDFELWMTNGEEDDFWFYQFSADEFYILPTDILFLILECLLLVTSVVIALILRARQMFHVTFKLFLVNMVLECISLLLECIANGEYAHNGVGLPFVKLCSEIFRSASTVTFLILLILMAKGYTITRGRLSNKGSWRIAWFSCMFILAYGCVFIWKVRVFDHGEVIYLYESPAGYAVIILRVLGWMWFCYAIYFTLTHYPEKRGFYFRFAISFSIWFWMGPIIILSSNLFISKWFREKTVNAAENTLAFLGSCAFLFITRPSHANKNFPYHVRTTQIDVINAADDDEDNSVNLPHHTYGLSHATRDVFTVSGRTRSPMENGQKKDPFEAKDKRKDEGPSAVESLTETTPSEGTKTTDNPPSYEEVVYSSDSMKVMIN